MDLEASTLPRDHRDRRSANIVRVIKSRRLIWAVHVARIEEGRSAFKISTGTPAGKIPLGRRRLDGSTVLEWVLKKYVPIRGIGLIRLRIAIIGGPLRH